ncbi:hypothetical protein Tco_0687052 [Tanacetum coccineum]
MAIHVVLPEIALEVMDVVASSIAALDPIIESGPKDQTQSPRPLRMSLSRLRMSHLRQLSLYLLRRSCHVSSSSGTLPASSGPLPNMRHHILSYSTPSASVRPSCKRCRFPTTSLLAATSTPVILSSIPADHLPSHKRFRVSPAISYEDATVKTIAEPVTPPVHHG